MSYKIAKSISGNPKFDKAAGIKAIEKFVSLHPHNISQRTRIMLEYLAKQKQWLLLLRDFMRWDIFRNSNAISRRKNIT